MQETLTPLSKILLLQNEKSYKNRIDIIIEEDIPVVCINNDTKKKRQMPFKALFDNNENFWRKEGSWKYFFSGESINKLKEKFAEKHENWSADPSKLEKKIEVATPVNDDIEELEGEPEGDDGFGSDYETFINMSPEQKVEHLNKDKVMLNEILAEKTRDMTEVTKVLVNTTKSAALINHAAIEQAINLADSEAKKLTQEMVNSTSELVKSSAQLISEDVFNNELMNALVEKSNGTIIQHMTRVYLNGIAFLSFYNNLVSTSSIIQKFRIAFPVKYRKYYSKLLEHMDREDINLEHVFLGGMRVIEPHQYFKWAVGFLIHDIGKAAAVEYHEGEESYDRNIVIDHVKQGFKSIVTKTNYPREASLITGYHHEYYGDPNGYGYFRTYLDQYQKANPKAKQDFCITYDLEPMVDFQALSYFPAKVLEIIDVYDSVTDPNRVYRKAMTPPEALNMMREEFIEKHFKIDIILFEIFAQFIEEKEKRR